MSFFETQRGSRVALAIACVVFLSCTAGCEVLAGIGSRSIGGSGGSGGAATVAQTTHAATTVSDTIASTGSGCGNLCDPKNCGAKGHDCLAGECLVGQCQPFVVALSFHPQALALDTTSVYFTNSDLNAILRCPLSGCGMNQPESIVSAFPGFNEMTTDATSIYFTDQGVASLWSCPLALPGCVPTQLIMNGTVDNPRQPQVDGADVYVPLLADGVQRCSKLGCATTTQVTPFEPAFGLTLDGPYLYWKSTQSVFRCLKSDCVATRQLVTDPAFLVDCQVIETQNGVLFLTAPTGLYRCDLATLPCAPTRISTYASGIRAFVLDSPTQAQNIYFSEFAVNGLSTVYRTPIDAADSMDPTVVADNQTDPVAFASNEHAVYWINFGANPPSEVMGIAK